MEEKLLVNAFKIQPFSFLGYSREMAFSPDSGFSKN